MNTDYRNHYYSQPRYEGGQGTRARSARKAAYWRALRDAGFSDDYIRQAVAKDYNWITTGRD